ncbi:3-hydroxyacyl-ACP dehydratase [Sphingobacterium griseoflavum]|uniref:3-hydroxyacyl-ACP dehydratase n=1 Tax=Sphingobacterium griseoflavum TaxID=1474952 RepID=A0ABQ3HZ95_9SPHI|nr:3-hydroxyacyl-ACP dehydratase [Sphingobacterium griseoflavum]GHE40672.1 3-hydroxyacyl-ACP dehydratase [Sphingobacterium griseoflavum]
MSLLKEFYSVESLEKQTDSRYVARICLNPKHSIFKGHFPGNPVTPGVCMMQIIKDLTEQITARTLFMSSSSNVKFMALINPEINPILSLQLDLALADEQTIKVKNVTTFDDTVALKLTNTYKMI